MILFLLLSLLFACSQSAEPPAPRQETSSARQAEQVTAAPVETALLTGITDTYNAHARARLNWAQRCLTYRKEFKEASVRTGYRAAFIAGLALHEGAGCRNIRGPSGERSMFQFFVPPTETERVWIALRGVSNLDWQDNVAHGAIAAMARFAHYEAIFHSRGHAILAYNAGPTGVARKAGFQGLQELRKSQKELPPVHALQGLTRVQAAYVQNVLADAVLMDRLMKGEEAKPLPQGEILDLEDIPGAVPLSPVSRAIAHAP